MDKYEYRVKTEQMLDHLEKKEYQKAMDIAESIDWRRVKSITMLLKVSALYRVNRRNEDSKAVSLRRGEIYCSWHLTEHREAVKSYID